MNNLKFFEGWVSHHRSVPVEHKFRYKMFQVWIDVKRVDLLDQVSRWWSSKGFNLVRFERQNYLPSDRSLHQEVCATIKQHTGNSFNGEAFLLANLSYWGYCFNPVIFVACYEGGELRYLISEVHNTPWNDRFIYVHDTYSVGRKTDNTEYHIANFDKAFYVSPFLPMDLQYQWKYHIAASRFYIDMRLFENGKSIFNTTLNLNGKPLTRPQANLIPFRFPLMCIKVVAAIYWQALLLWVKRVPFFSHPK